MAKEPWELTQAFAEQLMRNARNQEEQTTKLQLAPVEHAMALDRLKAAAAIELANLGPKLRLQDEIKQQQEARGEQQDIRKEQRGEETLKGREKRQEDSYKERHKFLTDEDIRKEGEKVYNRIRLSKENPEYRDLIPGARSGLGARGPVSKRPPTRENHEAPIVLPRDTFQQEDIFDQLEKAGYERPTPADIEGGEYGATNWLHPRRKGVPSGKTPARDPNTLLKQGERLVPTQPFVQPEPRNDYKDPPSKAGVGTNKAPPFDAVGPAKEPQGPPIPAELLKKKVSDLYQSIRRNGYSDEEARTVLASLQQPQVRPTDDPDIFDVLVS
jgi:hypothetical protein